MKSRTLCWFLALLMLIAPSTVLLAQSSDEVLPAENPIQAWREAERRKMSINNMKHINLAIHNAADRRKIFPPQDITNTDGKPLLSWRVRILPELEHGDLYKQFRLDEPWDSKHNKTLISKMPSVYLDPSSRWQVADGCTHYLGVKGTGFAFNRDNMKQSFASFRDGTANTIMLLQVNDERAAVWTKPDDWQFDEKKPFAGLVPTLHPGIFQASFADASVRPIEHRIKPAVFKKLLTIAGGEVVELP